MKIGVVCVGCSRLLSTLEVNIEERVDIVICQKACPDCRFKSCKLDRIEQGQTLRDICSVCKTGPQPFLKLGEVTNEDK